MGDRTGGKMVVVTGGNAGLGYECAKAIAASDRNWRVVLAVRGQEKGDRAAQRIAEETRNPGVEAMGLDLASLASVRSFAGELARRDDLPPLRAVVCNAGLQVVSGTTYTDDGFEETFGVNHLGHFLVVNLVLRQLEAPARIVFVSSGTHDPKRRTGMPAPRYRGAAASAYPEGHPDPEEEGEGIGKVGRRRYTASKLCNAMCAYELDRRLRAEGLSTPEAPIDANAFDPGAVPGTGLARDHAPLARFAWDRGAARLVPILRRLGVPFSTAETSGRALARLVTDPSLEGVSGRYFEIDEEARSSEESYDREKARELWETSAALVGLGPRETPLRVAAAAPGVS
ncbi:MAG: SDR family NAD(P)-dependent oxidoreductase [Actinomycetota bacterium]|nr:SDR family NAD(P)-dependent oxidoreductase [Actinomycetota bacterium]